MSSTQGPFVPAVAEPGGPGWAVEVMLMLRLTQDLSAEWWPSATQQGGEARKVPRWERLAHATVGVGFGCAAVGNLVGFLPRAEELLPWFARTAWLPPYAWLIDRLVPLAPALVTAAAVFKATVAVMLLTRRHVPLALGLAAAWMLGLMPAVGWPYWTPNLVVGIAVALLSTRAYRRVHGGLLLSAHTDPRTPTEGP